MISKVEERMKLPVEASATALAIADEETDRLRPMTSSNSASLMLGPSRGSLTNGGGCINKINKLSVNVISRGFTILLNTQGFEKKNSSRDYRFEKIYFDVFFSFSFFKILLQILCKIPSFLSFFFCVGILLLFHVGN